MTTRQVNEMMKGVYSGKYSRQNLPTSYYKSFDSRMQSAISESFGSRKGKAYKELYQDLSINRQAFSGAKTYQLTKELQAARRGAKTYDAYLDKALPIFEKYERWGDTEINTAVANAQNARKWIEIEANADDLPKLRYSAIIDPNTSEICRPLDGITAPIGHPIWRKFAPTNHFNCRCLLEQVGKEARSTSKNKLEKLDNQLSKEVSSYFQVNVGQTRELFSSGHPYFKEVPKVDRSFAKKNFGIPIK